MAAADHHVFPSSRHHVGSACRGSLGLPPPHRLPRAPVTCRIAGRLARGGRDSGGRLALELARIDVDDVSIIDLYSHASRRSPSGAESLGIDLATRQSSRRWIDLGRGHGTTSSCTPSRPSSTTCAIGRASTAGLGQHRYVARARLQGCTRPHHRPTSGAPAHRASMRCLAATSRRRPDPASDHQGLHRRCCRP